MGFLGCCGSISQNLKMLKVFFYYILALLFVEILAGVLAYVYSGELVKQLESAWTEFGKGLDPVKVGVLSTIQKDYKCCGGKSYLDWVHAFTDAQVALPRPYGSTFDFDDPKLSDTPFPNTCCPSNVGDEVACNSDASLLYTSGCVGSFVGFITSNLLAI